MPTLRKRIAKNGVSEGIQEDETSRKTLLQKKTKNQKIEVEALNEDETEENFNKTKSIKNEGKKKNEIFNLQRISEFFTALILLISLPSLTIILIYLCCEIKERPIPIAVASYFKLKEFAPFEYFEVSNFVQSMLILLSWHCVCIFLYAILPGETVEGLPIEKNGIKLRYKINGHLQFWVTLFIFLFCFPTSKNGNLVFEHFPLHLLTGKMYFYLLFSSILLSFIFAIFLFFSSFFGEKISSKISLETKSSLYVFWLGRELNPRLFNTIDWKVYFDLRPSLIGWTLLNVGFLLAEKERKGYNSISLILLAFTQGVYTWDALFHEASILSTLDITTEGLGFMLIFGSVTWIPFIYSLQGFALLYFDPELTLEQAALLFLLFCFGFWIFRASNSAKDSFRRKKKTIDFSEKEVKSSTLLTTGWWGLARKINYTGDLLIALSWCLLAGFKNIVTMFYFVFLLSLLTHRAYRDHYACKAKHGKKWDEYCQMVPSVFIPYVI